MDKPAVVFGDVHGESAQLARLISLARQRFGDVDLISVGDLIDRGPDSRGVLDLCVREGVRGIVGNHELWLREVLAGGPMHDGIYAPIMGGLATLRSYGLSRGDPDNVARELRKVVPKAHRDWLLGLVPWTSLESDGRTWLVTHAGVTRSQWEGTGSIPLHDAVDSILRAAPDAFYWLGAKPTEPDRVARIPGVVQVFGHHVVGAPVRRDHYVALDTGCGTAEPRILSALVLRDGHEPEILQVR